MPVTMTMMTIERLNEHRTFVIMLQESKTILASMQAQILKAMDYNGLPHVQEPSRTTENLSILLETQIADVNRLEAIVAESEKEIKAFVDSIPDNRTRVIFNLRFVCGMKWDSVARMIGGGNASSTMRSVCTRYLETCNTVQHSHS